MDCGLSSEYEAIDFPRYFEAVLGNTFHQHIELGSRSLAQDLSIRVFLTSRLFPTTYGSG
jgi:hypothetical protein